MQRPLALLAAFLLIALITVLMGTAQMGWNVAALPVWFWRVPVLAGLLVILGGWLMKQASPQRPLWQRTLLIGASWGLPLTVMYAGMSLLHEQYTPTSLLLLVLVWAVMALIFGRIMAGLQRPA